MTNLPNLLTLFRIALIPALCATLYVPGHTGDWLALGLFLIAALTDFLDGWIARRYSLQSGFGRMLDPIADKLVVATCLMLLVAQEIIVLPHLLAAIIIMCREILVSGLREYLSTLQIRMPVSVLAKYKTVIQMTAIGFLMSHEAGVALLAPAHTIGIVLLWVAAVLTLITGYDYMRQSIKHA